MLGGSLAGLSARITDSSGLLALTATIGVAWIALSHQGQAARLAGRLADTERARHAADEILVAQQEALARLRARHNRIDLSLSLWRELAGRLEHGDDTEAASAAVELCAIRCGATGGSVHGADRHHVLARYGDDTREEHGWCDLWFNRTVKTAADLRRPVLASDVADTAEEDSDVAIPVLDPRDDGLSRRDRPARRSTRRSRAAELRDLVVVAELARQFRPRRRRSLPVAVPAAPLMLPRPPRWSARRPRRPPPSPPPTSPSSSRAPTRTSPAASRPGSTSHRRYPERASPCPHRPAPGRLRRAALHDAGQRHGAGRGATAARCRPGSRAGASTGHRRRGASRRRGCCAAFRRLPPRGRGRRRADRRSRARATSSIAEFLHGDDTFELLAASIYDGISPDAAVPGLLLALPLDARAAAAAARGAAARGGASITRSPPAMPAWSARSRASRAAGRWWSPSTASTPASARWSCRARPGSGHGSVRRAAAPRRRRCAASGRTSSACCRGSRTTARPGCHPERGQPRQAASPTAPTRTRSIVPNGVPLSTRQARRRGGARRRPRHSRRRRRSRRRQRQLRVGFVGRVVPDQGRDHADRARPRRCATVDLELWIIGPRGRGPGYARALPGAGRGRSASAGQHPASSAPSRSPRFTRSSTWWC